jgi:hypothetical protein
VILPSYTVIEGLEGDASTGMRPNIVTGKEIEPGMSLIL